MPCLCLEAFFLLTFSFSWLMPYGGHSKPITETIRTSLECWRSWCHVGLSKRKLCYWWCYWCWKGTTLCSYMNSYTISTSTMLVPVELSNIGILVLVAFVTWMISIYVSLAVYVALPFVIIFFTYYSWNTTDELWRLLPYSHSLHGADWSEMQTFLQPFKLYEVWEGWFWEDCHPTILSLRYADGNLFPQEKAIKIASKFCPMRFILFLNI